MLRLIPAALVAFTCLGPVLKAGEISLLPTELDSTRPIKICPVEGRMDGWGLDIETSVMWRITNMTNLDYVVVPTAISLRTPAHTHWQVFGGDLLVRARGTLLGEWIAKGPESHYFGVSGSPSIEYWFSKDTYIHYSVGGGFGWIDSQGVSGGQGQDFTYNWFMSAGIRHYVSDNFAIGVGAMYQHLSNRGATDPNPGLDAFGPMIGVSYSW